MKVPVRNVRGKEIGSVELPTGIFGAKVNRDLMHQALVRQLSNARRGTHKAKTRSEVRRTTAKWYRQKGTGRARHGNRRAPIFVGGGVAHGPLPRSYRKDMPRKMRRAALRSALTAKAISGDIVILDRLTLDQPQTRKMAKYLEGLTDGVSTLVIMADKDENVELSTRNITNAKALRVNYLNIRDLLGFHKIVMPLDAVEVIQAYLGEEGEEMISAEIDTDLMDEEE